MNSNDPEKDTDPMEPDDPEGQPAVVGMPIRRDVPFIPSTPLPDRRSPFTMPDEPARRKERELVPV